MPVSAVNTTSDITRGFISATKSPTLAAGPICRAQAAAVPPGRIGLSSDLPAQPSAGCHASDVSAAVVTPTG